VASEIVAGVIGAGVGAILTAGGTWRVSVSLDRRHATRELIGAINVVRAELTENAERLRKHEHPGALTHGDWARSKVILANLSDSELWDDVRRTYKKIFEVASGRDDPDPSKELSAENLESLDVKLQAAATRLEH
jgi:hypothetical protein